MNRLAVRLTLVIVAVTLLTIAIMFGVQIYGISREHHALPARLRPAEGRIFFFIFPVPKDNFPASKKATPPPLRYFAGKPRDAVPAAQSRLPVASTAPNYKQLRSMLQGFFYRRLNELLISAALSVTLGIALALIFARRIARPIERVTRAAALVSHGNLAARVPLNEQLSSSDETVQLSRSFNAMASSLERLETERKAMIADIAHELRTPLTIMRGRLEALEDGLASFDTGEVQNLHRQVLLLSRLVDDLRTLSLAEAGRLPVEKRSTDVSQLAAKVLSSFEKRAQERAVRLELNAPEALLAEVDPDRIAQVLGNLLDNALRYAPEHGWVQLSLTLCGQSVEFRVSDSGPGLPQEVRERIFDRFFRFDVGTRAQGGSGLGLAIVKSLVQLHGGTVTAANASTGGAEFRVVLPAKG